MFRSITLINRNHRSERFRYFSHHAIDRNRLRVYPYTIWHTSLDFPTLTLALRLDRAVSIPQCTSSWTRFPQLLTMSRPRSHPMHPRPLQRASRSHTNPSHVHRLADIPHATHLWIKSPPRYMPYQTTSAVPAPSLPGGGSGACSVLDQVPSTADMVSCHYARSNISINHVFNTS